MRTCPKCGKKWSDYDLMTKGGIEIGDDGDISYFKCPNCGTKLSMWQDKKENSKPSLWWTESKSKRRRIRNE